MRGRTGGSAYLGRLPRGCILCGRGSKLVVFVTGVCVENCYYCPISFRRWGRDLVYANEREAHSLDDILEEAAEMGAEGASITGGEPLLRLERTARIIKMLKDVFSQEFHVHLYTIGSLASAHVLKDLERAGLDEIRFHVTRPETVRRIREAASNTSMDVGVEVPAIPGETETLKRIVAEAAEAGASFVNINELEASERNVNKLRQRGMSVREDYPVAVEGSLEAAMEVLGWAEREGLDISVHVCTARFKDLVQTRRRLLRKARTVKMHYQRVTGDGLLEELALESEDRGALEEAVQRLRLSKNEYAIERADETWILRLHPSVISRIPKGLRARRRLLYPVSPSFTVYEEEVSG